MRRLGLADQSAYQILNIYDLKILVLSHPFGDLWVTHRVHLLSEPRLKAYGGLLISDNCIFFVSSHGRVTIKLNLSKSEFSEGVGHYERKF